MKDLILPLLTICCGLNASAVSHIITIEPVFASIATCLSVGELGKAGAVSQALYTPTAKKIMAEAAKGELLRELMNYKRVCNPAASYNAQRAIVDQAKAQVQDFVDKHWASLNLQVRARHLEGTCDCIRGGTFSERRALLGHRTVAHVLEVGGGKALLSEDQTRIAGYVQLTRMDSLHAIWFPSRIPGYTIEINPHNLCIMHLIPAMLTYPNDTRHFCIKIHCTLGRLFIGREWNTQTSTPRPCFLSSELKDLKEISS